MRKVVVYTGTRYPGPEAAAAWKDVMDLNPQEVVVFVGDAMGVDERVREACQERGVPYAVFKALWKKKGRSAGPRRNRFMLETAKAIVSAGDWGSEVELRAFPGPDSKGTWRCIEAAEDLGITVKICTPFRRRGGDR
jgi:hypothetical protein